MMPANDQPQQPPVPPSPEELSQRIAQEKFQDRYTELTKDFNRSRDPALTWDARFAAKHHFCETAIELLREYEPGHKLDQVAMAVSKIELPRIAISAAGPFRAAGFPVVQLSSVNDVADYPPEGSWVEAFKLRNEQNARAAWYAIDRITTGLMELLGKHKIVDWKQQDLGF